jgi:peptidyl-prolyl cis-trans isomerase D
MLNSMRKGQRWLTLIFVILIGGVFVLFMGVGDGFTRGRPTGNAVIELGDIRLSANDFYRLRSQNEENLRERVGDEFDATAMRAFIDAQTLRNLEDGAILADGAQELGLEVPTAEIKRVVQNAQAFRDESGRFVPEAFDAFANREYGGQRNFLEVMRQDLLRQKMMRVLYEQVSVSPAELELAALYDLEEVRLAYVALDTETLPGEPLSDEDVSSYLAEHEEEVRGVYADRAELYAHPEQVHARHILVGLDAEADEAVVEATRARALALRARLIEGEDFAALALAESDDLGTREDGGDLGFFARGQNLAEFDEAAFALAPGDLSEPIQTDTGFHLILVEERREAGKTPFEDVSLELARELATKAAAGERAQQTASALAEQVRAGESLEAAARGRLLTLERTGMLRRRPDGFVPGLGAASELLATAFTLDPDAASSPRIFTVGSQLVLIQLLERSSPDEDTLADALLAAEQQLLDAKRNRMIQDWVDARREQLRAEGRLLVNTELVIANS